MKTFEFGELVELRKEKYNPLTNDTVPCIELEHINQNSGTINGYVNSIEQKSIKNVFHKGDILFAKLRPYLKKYWFAEFDGVCSSEIWVLKPKTVVTAEYLFCLIQTEEFIRIANVSFGSKMPRADWDFINHYPFTIIHSLPEQQRIVSILSLWDTAIAKQTALIEKLTLRKRGLMQQLLTGKKRLKGFEGEWKEVRLGEIFDERNETNRGDLPLLSITGDRGVIYQSESDKRDISNDDKSKYKRICPNDIGYNTMRMWQGRSALSELEGIVSPAYTIVIPRDNVDVRFVAMLIQQPRVVYGFWTHSQGLVSDTLNCKYPDFCQVKVTIPSKKEQAAIADFFVEIDKEIEIQKQKLSILQEQKKGLMQVLLTGKRRVK